MRVQVFPADEGACGAFRLIWPAEALAAQGADVEVRFGESLEGYTTADGRLVDVKAPGADLVVFQRPTQRWFAEAIPMLQAKGVAVAIDIDDDFHCADPRNSAYPGLHPKLSPERNYEHLGRALRECDMVTVTTPALAERYGAHGRVTVLPNLVPERYLDLKVSQAADECEPHPDRAWVANGPLCRRHLARHHESACAEGAQPGNNCSPGGPHQEPRETGALVVVGWAGSVGTHPGDLEVTRGSVQAALSATGARFHVVGPGTGVAERLRLAEEPTNTGWVGLDEYPARVAELDVGIVPLADTAFNRGKSALKLAEYGALGVACVGSPTPDNQRLNRLGVGLLARKPRDWRRELDLLIRDNGWRAELAGRGREAMRAQTIEGRCGAWWEAWERAAENQAFRRTA